MHMTDTYVFLGFDDKMCPVFAARTIENKLLPCLRIPLQPKNGPRSLTGQFEEWITKAKLEIEQDLNRYKIKNGIIEIKKNIYSTTNKYVLLTTDKYVLLNDGESRTAKRTFANARTTNKAYVIKYLASPSYFVLVNVQSDYRNPNRFAVIHDQFQTEEFRHLTPVTIQQLRVVIDEHAEAAQAEHRHFSPDQAAAGPVRRIKQFVIGVAKYGPLNSVFIVANSPSSSNDPWTFSRYLLLYDTWGPLHRYLYQKNEATNTFKPRLLGQDEQLIQNKELLDKRQLPFQFDKNLFNKVHLVWSSHDWVEIIEEICFDCVTRRHMPSGTLKESTRREELMLDDNEAVIGRGNANGIEGYVQARYDSHNRELQFVRIISQQKAHRSLLKEIRENDDCSEQMRWSDLRNHDDSVLKIDEALKNNTTELWASDIWIPVSEVSRFVSVDPEIKYTKTHKDDAFQDIIEGMQNVYCVS